MTNYIVRAIITNVENDNDRSDRIAIKLKAINIDDAEEKVQRLLDSIAVIEF